MFGGRGDDGLCARMFDGRLLESDLGWRWMSYVEAGAGDGVGWRVVEVKVE